jgi:hypothetical protein
MGGRPFVRLALSAALMLVAACGDGTTTDSTNPPQPATAAEMEAFCDAYEAVRSKSFGEITTALIEVSPDEIRTQMVRASNFPTDGWEEIRSAVEGFLDRCDDL